MNYLEQANSQTNSSVCAEGGTLEESLTISGMRATRGEMEMLDYDRGYTNDQFTKIELYQPFHGILLATKRKGVR